MIFDKAAKAIEWRKDFSTKGVGTIAFPYVKKKENLDP